MKEARSVVYQFLLLVIVLGLCGCQGPSKDSIKVPGATQWTDSGIDARKGQVISVQAAGDVYINEKIRSNPNGIDHPTIKPITKLVLRRYNVTSEARHGALIGKIGKKGNPFLLGAQGKVKADSVGRLYLGLNDKNPENNRGHYVARVSVN